MTVQPKPNIKPSKADRLADALRANLRRRKAPGGQHNPKGNSSGKDCAAQDERKDGI